MALETKCAWCGGILLDAEHARLHVVEQCKKAPWREELLKLRRDLSTFRVFLAVLVHRMGSGLRITQHEIENLPLGNLTVKEADTGDVIFAFEPPKQGR